jgi:hypothetical protein
VEVLAGVRSPGELRLRPSPALPGMDPVTSTVMMGQLGAACRRGLVVPWPPDFSDAGGTPTWQEGPGAVVRCWNGAEASAQAVVVLHGLGGSQVLGPRPGGAVLIRAWRVGRVWGVVCAVVLGASGALGLGREAARLAAGAAGAGWQAMVPRGAEALAVARAGDPREPIPLRAARRATQDELAALVGICLEAGLAPVRAPGSGPEPGLASAPVSSAGRRARLAWLLQDLDRVDGPDASEPLPG